MTPDPTQDPYANETTIKTLFDRCLEDALKNPTRQDRDRADMENLHFYRGGADNQWMVWDQATSSHIPRGDDPHNGGIPPWVHRATTNKFAVKIDGICSLLNQSEPAQEWKPRTDDDADIAAADVAGDAVPVLLDEIDYAALKPRINKLVALTDRVGVCYYYDTDPKWGMGDLELFACQNPECPDRSSPRAYDLEELGEEETCPSCGGPVALALDGQAQPITRQEPIGKICADLIPSFGLSLPSSCTVPDERHAAWVLTHDRMDKNEVRRIWGEKAERALVGDGGSSSSSPMQRHFADTMRRLAAPLHGRATAIGANADTMGPVVYRFWHDPITEEQFQFPEGVYAVVVNDVIVDHGPLPFVDDRGRALKNVLIRTFAAAPGAPHGKPPGDDLVPLQKKANLTESLLLLILMNDAAPTLYMPLSVSLEDVPTGMPGETVRYRSLDGSKPFKEHGMNPPEGLYKYLEIIDEQFDEVSKLNAVLQGERAAGDPTLGEVELLAERGMGTFKDPFAEQIAFEKRQSLLLLHIARQTGWSPRFRQIKGENGDWKVEQFRGADLTGSVDVMVEPATAWPKSEMMQTLRLQKAVELGIIIPMQDPEVQVKLLQKWNLADLKQSLDLDTQQVMREIDKWKAAHSPMEIAPPNPAKINPQIHLHYKSSWLKSEEFELLEQMNPPVAQAILLHVSQLHLMLMPAPAPAEPGKAGPPDGSAVDQAVESGALQPASGQADPVEEAVNSGAMQPAGGGDPLADAMQAGALQPADLMAQQQVASLPSVDDLVAARVMTPAPPVNGSGQTTDSQY